MIESARVVLEKPNGGFGWAVVFGAFLTNVFNQAFLSVFSLLFGPFFNAIHETNLALVVNLSCLFLNLSGLVTGALLKKFSPRQVCIAASLMTSVGVSLSSVATSLYQIIIAFSFLTGTGLGLLSNALLVAVTSYFTTRKQRAVSLAMAGTGIGQIWLPQIVRFLISHFSYRETIFIMGGLMLNGIVGALLFHPVEWHMKVRSENDESQRLLSQDRANAVAINSNQQSFWRRVTHSMDLSLLKDSHFVILSIGLAAGYAVSVDFTLVLPIFLQETVMLNKDQTAICLSTLATFDLISRLTFHFFTSKLNISSREIYVIGLILLGVTRSVMAELTNYTAILFACAIFGYFRALVVVNQILIISDHCTRHCPEKFGGALGLNMIFRSISIISFGQLLVFARNYSDSYVGLHAENFVLIFILIVWTIEYLYKKR